MAKAKINVEIKKYILTATYYDKKGNLYNPGDMIELKVDDASQKRFVNILKEVVDKNEANLKAIEKKVLKQQKESNEKILAEPKPKKTRKAKSKE